MLVIQEKRGEFQMRDTMGFRNSSFYSTLSDSDLEKLVSLREKVITAFTESERRNDEKIFTIKSNMIDKTVNTMIEAEKQNDQRIKDMINAIPDYKAISSEIVYESNQFSFDLISALQ